MAKTIIRLALKNGHQNSIEICLIFLILFYKKPWVDFIIIIFFFKKVA